MPEIRHQDERATIFLGDALSVLAAMRGGSVDAVVTDPPYSSGGLHRSDRANTTITKYVSTSNTHRADLVDFGGDNRDQRAYAYWCALWLAECLRVTRPGGVCLLFCDWRQLPATSDALQSGGWVWRGVVPWHKPNARPQRGRFSAHCEYVVWGSHGPMPAQDGDPCLPGFYVGDPPRDRQHITQKPLDVVRQLVRIAPAGGLILDPFAGSGATGVAAILEGRRFVGIEHVAHYADVTAERIQLAQLRTLADGDQAALDFTEETGRA